MHMHILNIGPINIFLRKWDDFVQIISNCSRDVMFFMEHFSFELFLADG